MLVVFTAGIALWLWYRLEFGSLPVVLADGITLALSATLVALTLFRLG